MSANLEFDGKRILVTAGTKGIGGATVELFCHHGRGVCDRRRHSSHSVKTWLQSHRATPKQALRMQARRTATRDELVRFDDLLALWRVLQAGHEA